MKIGIVVDGLGEFKSLPEICARLCLRQGDQLLAPVHARLQPKSAPGRIAESVLKKLDLLRKRGADVVLLLIDREDRAECAPELAQAIEAVFVAMSQQVRVVVKNRKFENWLIADPKALASLKGRFKPTVAFRKHVSQNKADNVADAAALLNRICVKSSYHKTQDPPKILAAMDVAEAGKNSRSFRRFLRLVGDRRYRDQSRKP